jgi:flagellar L-ring protein precursor FlgH
MKFSNLLIVISLMILGVCASADSLWTPASKSMISDPKAHQVGDTITVTVTEATSTEQKTSSNFSKSLTHNNSAGVGPVVKLLPQLGVNSSQSGAAAGDTSKTMTFTATVTTQVVKVLPNGNLQIEGTHHVETNQEKQDISISGIARPEDIDSNNNIASTSLANFEVKCTGKGAIGDRQKEGVLSKLLKYLF